METVEVDLRLNLKLSHSFYSVWMAIHSLRSTLSLPTSQGFKETTMGITRSACTFAHSLPFVYMDLWRILLFLAPRGVAREGVLLQGLERGLEKSFRVFGIHPCYTFLTLATRRSATLHSPLICPRRNLWTGVPKQLGRQIQGLAWRRPGPASI
jgi:hypothetical protein